MLKSRQFILSLSVLLSSFSALTLTNLAVAASAADINKDSQHALEKLYGTSPTAESLSHKAKAILVFPSIVKGGFVVGGSYGEGELLKQSKVQGYYNSAAATFGLQAGAQSYGYVVMLMSNKAARYLNTSKGWEIGVGPTVVLINEGAAKNLSTTTQKADAYAFIFGQQGLMAGVSIEGTKISKIKR